MRSRSYYDSHDFHDGYHNSYHCNRYNYNSNHCM